MRVFLAIITSISLLGSLASANCGDNLNLNSISPLNREQKPQLVSHTVRFEVAVSADEFLNRFHEIALSKLLPGTKKLSGVADITVIANPPFGGVKSRRIICQKDGNTAIEEVIQVVPGRSFKYQVWDYSTPVAKPIEYGIGEFVAENIAPNRARISWTYSFKLKQDQLPGKLGAAGRGLFQVTFLNTAYSDFMKAGATAMQKEFTH